jgi:hypothetical protein
MPRSAHNQTLDDANKCGSANPYSKVGLEPGEYCGLGCLGEACLYYQIGCYAGCPTCSLVGKDLYPTEADLVKADFCKPMAPTLGGGDPAHEYELRTNNRDGLSTAGDWTKWNPWRAPGTAGRGNSQFEPCGINSGAKDTPTEKVPNPQTTSHDVPKSGPGTALKPVGAGPTWKRGTVVDVSWALYANHGGGYSYRLCKKSADGSPVTEACFQQNPLKFVGNTTTIRYGDNSRPAFQIPAVTTSVGTFPAGSTWRKNPVPMCNCDVGYNCYDKDAAGAGPNMLLAYNKTNFHPGQKSTFCPTGVQYPTMWDGGEGAPPYMAGTGMTAGFNFVMEDQVQVPAAISAGDYQISWRWDCEETPQVWNSCADLTIV